MISKVVAETEKARADHLRGEIDKLAAYILERWPAEPGKGGSESAVDVAIRLMERLQYLAHDREVIPELVNALIGMVQQHCIHHEDYVSTSGLSAHEDAIFLLEGLGYLEQVGPHPTVFRFRTHENQEVK